jgi:hypothetical protein
LTREIIVKYKSPLGLKKIDALIVVKKLKAREISYGD